MEYWENTFLQYTICMCVCVCDYFFLLLFCFVEQAFVLLYVYTRICWLFPWIMPVSVPIRTQRAEYCVFIFLLVLLQ